MELVQTPFASAWLSHSSKTHFILFFPSNVSFKLCAPTFMACLSSLVAYSKHLSLETLNSVLGRERHFFPLFPIWCRSLVLSLSSALKCSLVSFQNFRLLQELSTPIFLAFLFCLFFWLIGCFEYKLKLSTICFWT